MLTKKEILHFKPEWKVIRRINPAYLAAAEIKNFPMFFQSSIEFIYNNSKFSPYQIMMDCFISSVLNDLGLKEFDNQMIIDSRIHMLMPSFFPCIPGWHTDFVERGANGQPDINDQTEVMHYMMILGNTSFTEFLDEPVTLSMPPENSIYYGHWNEEIKKQNLKTYTVKSGEIIRFDKWDWHRGMPATENGWRYFIRLSYYLNKKIEHKNEIRRQVQVYLPALEGGW